MRYISVPKNQIGIDEYNHCEIEKSENLEMFELPDDEFDILFNNGVFEYLNEKHHLLIDDYESEKLDVSVMDDCMEQIKNLDVPIFRKAVEMVVEHKTLLGLDF